MTEISADEAAIVTTEEGEGIYLLLPDYDENHEMPHMMTVLAAVALRINSDPIFVQEQLDWFARELNSNGKNVKNL
jgi:hypothetical protein